MSRQLVPKTVSTSRFALTAEMSRKLAKKIEIGGEIIHYGSIMMTGGCFLRVFTLIVGWQKNGYLNTAIFLISGVLGWGLAQLCFVAIWRGTSGYHQRQEHRVLRGYSHGRLLDLSKEVIFGIWYVLDSGVSLIAFLAIALTNTVSIMFVVQAQNVLASLVVSAVAGLFIMFMAIALPITAGHIEDHAKQLEAYTEMAKKYWHIQEVQMLGMTDEELAAASQPQNLPAQEPPKGLRSGNTVTGQWEDIDDDEPVDVPIDSPTNMTRRRV